MNDDFLDLYREYDRRLSMNESPDAISIKSSFGYIVDWTDPDARPFGMYDGVMYVSKRNETHEEMGRDLANELDLNVSRLNRKDFQYAGRLWWRSKVISFWEYPPRNKLKKVIDLINRAMKEQGDRVMIDGSWRIDIPADTNSDRLKPVGYGGGSDWMYDNDQSYSYLYSIKNVLAGKELKGTGKAWRDMGINMDTGQSHIDSPVKKQLKKLTKRQKKELWNYFRRLGAKDWSPADRALHNYMKSKLR